MDPLLPNLTPPVDGAAALLAETGVADPRPPKVNPPLAAGGGGGAACWASGAATFPCTFLLNMLDARDNSLL